MECGRDDGPGREVGAGMPMKTAAQASPGFAAQGTDRETGGRAAGSVVGLFKSPIGLRDLVDEMPLGVIITDLERRIVFMNRQFEVLTGFSGDKMAGVPCRDVLRCDHCLTGCLAEEARKKQGPVTKNCTIITRERAKTRVTITSVPISDPRGVLYGFMETVSEEVSAEAGQDSVMSRLKLGSFVGRSRKMEELYRLLPVVAQTDSSVLITGETGTGKDLVAEIIHRNSDRAQGAFIKINCGSLPETLLESELFGHVKGAFTGAVSDKLGRFRLAHNGTVFLTEIGDLPLVLQVKLLTFLDDRMVHPLGSTKGFQADVRVVAATHRNLEQMVREGEFRQDLLYRLNVVRLHLPPLREREGDAAHLLDHFLKFFSARFKVPNVEIEPRAREFLLNYSYPGNVRELRNIVEYAVNISQGERIRFDQLPAYLFEAQPLVQPTAAPSRMEQEEAGPATRPGPEAKWSDAERGMILDALLKSRGRKGEAAKRLGWSRSTLWRKIRQHGLDAC